MFEHPKVGSVVSCYFPMNETPCQPGTQARPALVLGTIEDPENPEVKKIVVSYGTSRRTRAHLGFEIRIITPEKMQETKLHRATRFTLNRLRVLPYTEEYFDFSDAGETAVIGMIPGPELDRLDGYLDSLSRHSQELNFLNTKAPKNATTTSYDVVDAYMRENLTGVQMIKRPRAALEEVC